MRGEKVVIIIPTFNEGLGIAETVAAVFTATADLNYEVHILVFDSASLDNTASIVRDLQNNHPNLHLQTETKKSGLGSAYWQAMHHALYELNADIVIEFDADLSHQPKYLGPMLNQLENYDVVIGSRYVSGGAIPNDWSWDRKFLSIIGNYIARSCLTWKYKDFTSGFKITRRQALIKALPAKFISNNYAYKLELLWRLHKNKARILEVPIVFIDRKQGVSKLPTNSIFDSLNVLFSLRFGKLAAYFKMCIVGLSGSAVQYIFYNLLRQKLPPVVAIQIAVLAAMINNFTLNSSFTFRKNILKFNIKSLKSCTLFISYSVLMISLQSYWLYLGMTYLGTGFFKENLIILSGIIWGSILNYIIYSRYVWQTSS